MEKRQDPRAQESMRQGQESEAHRQPSQARPPREAAPDITRAAGQLAGLCTETLTAWTDTGQRALRDVTALSAQATQEGARQLTEWQQTNLELMREMQMVAFRLSTAWPEFWCAPIRGYQRSLEESIDAGHRLLELTRRNAEMLAQSCQRLERAADDATRTLGETFREATTRMQAVAEKSDRLRAA